MKILPLVATLLAATAPAYAQDDLKELAPPQDEIVQALQQIENVASAPELRLEDLRSPLDKHAYAEAERLLARRMEQALASIGKMKQAVLRYAVITSKTNLDADSVAAMTGATSKAAQDLYNKAVDAITFAAYDDFQKALVLCASELCVTEVHQAYSELLSFGAALNRDLDFSGLKSSYELYWKFETPMLKRSFASLWRERIKPNEDHNFWVASVVAPLSVAGLMAKDALKGVVQTLANPRYREIRLTVLKAPLRQNGVTRFLARPKQFTITELVSWQSGVFKENYEKAVAGALEAEGERYRLRIQVEANPESISDADFADAAERGVGTCKLGKDRYDGTGRIFENGEVSRGVQVNLGNYWGNDGGASSRLALAKLLKAYVAKGGCKL
jgi:hypothetical protein